MSDLDCENTETCGVRVKQRSSWFGRLMSRARQDLARLGKFASVVLCPPARARLRATHHMDRMDQVDCANGVSSIHASGGRQRRKSMLLWLPPLFQPTEPAMHWPQLPNRMQKRSVATGGAQQHAIRAAS
jgi:hypothetical protein